MDQKFIHKFNHIIVNCQRSMREDISGAKAAIRETIPCPTWGFDLRVFLKYPIGRVA